MIDKAFSAWRDARAVGQSIVVVAPDHSTVDALVMRARAERIVAGEVEPAGLTVAGQLVGRGDEIVTTRNDRRLVTSGGLWVRNGDRWHVDVRRDDGTLVVSHLDGYGRVVLPADYAADHVALAYAVTVHKAEGLTVDCAVLLADAATSAEHLYVGMTRGRHENRVCVVTEAATTGHGHRWTLEPVEILRLAMSQSSAERSATETLRHELDRGEDTATLRGFGNRPASTSTSAPAPTYAPSCAASAGSKTNSRPWPAPPPPNSGHSTASTAGSATSKPSPERPRPHSKVCTGGDGSSAPTASPSRKLSTTSSLNDTTSTGLPGVARASLTSSSEAGNDSTTPNEPSTASPRSKPPPAGAANGFSTTPLNSIGKLTSPPDSGTTTKPRIGEPPAQSRPSWTMTSSPTSASTCDPTSPRTCPDPASSGACTTPLGSRENPIDATSPSRRRPAAEWTAPTLARSHTCSRPVPADRQGCRSVRARHVQSVSFRGCSVLGVAVTERQLSGLLTGQDAPPEH
ncbi:MAG TPA: ATP-binding domain-containing protein [Acidimicrobiia bacterium]|nr:ATP-binding domain-containing protein [Acidimicrobiia bacterium]